MQIILMEKIDNLGSLGEIVNVKAGYARNFLVPRRKAKIASKANIEAFEEIRAELEKVEAASAAAAEKIREKLDGTEITIEANAGQEGKLFGSVSNAEIAEALQAEGFEIERRDVRMPEGPIRNVGEHEVGIHLFTDVMAMVKVTIHSENVIEVVERSGAIGTFVDDDDR